MTDIVIHFRDEIRCRLECDRSIMLEIKEKFSFMSEGFAFHPSYKAGWWDGKVSMINTKDSSFYIGLLPDLVKFAKDGKYSISFSQNDKPLFRGGEDVPADFFIECRKYSKFEPKDYQRAAIEQALKQQKILVLSPTASGKSYIIYLILRYLFTYQNRKDVQFLITVPSKSLAEQLKSDFKDYATDNWDVDGLVDTLHGTGSGKITSKKPIIISTWQTACKQSVEWFSRFTHYTCDEAHGAKSTELTKIIDMLPNVKFRLGLTGTLNGTSLHELEMIARFGKVFKMVTTKQLMDRGDIARLEIEAISLKYKKEDCRSITTPGIKYDDEISWLVDHRTRNDILVNIAMQQKDNTLMLFNYVERHGLKILDDLFKLSELNLKRINLVYGDVDVSKREDIRKRMDGSPPKWYDIYFDDFMIRVADSPMLGNKSVSVGDQIDNAVILDSMLDKPEQPSRYYTGTFQSDTITKIVEQVGCDILLASYGTLAVGVNIKNLHVLIFCHPLKSKIRILQSIGRILRCAAGKSFVRLFDIVDDLCYTTPKGKKRENYTYKHFVERLKMYQDEGFEYKISQDSI